MGPTWGPSGADRTQVAPMLAPWTLLSGIVTVSEVSSFSHRCTRWPDISAQLLLILSSEDKITRYESTYVWNLFLQLTISKEIWIRPCLMPSLTFYAKNAESTKHKVGLVQSITNLSWLSYVLPRKKKLQITWCQNVVEHSTFYNTVSFSCAKSTVFVIAIVRLFLACTEHHVYHARGIPFHVSLGGLTVFSVLVG